MQLIDGYLVFSDAWFFEVRLLLLGGLLLAAALSDILWRRIPNLLVLGGLCAAFAVHLVFPSDLGWRRAASGMALGFSLLLPFYLLRGMAAGDVKLMAMVGAFLGPQLTVATVVMTFLVGGAWAVVVVSRGGAWSQLFVNFRSLKRSAARGSDGAANVSVSINPSSASVGRMPYGAVIAIGTGVALLAFRAGYFL
ncbi:MAG: prepilin peptidase [Rhodocyclales bacterium]|nr:prepilin peptidase [Rhodocyclales bacterium]